MEQQKARITLPEIARALGLTRATTERLVAQYAQRIPPCERVGIIRTWPAEVVETLKSVLQEEERLREQRR
ncbi:MAG: hypothetical protein HY716_06830 [Planctomycetes bacterium]|nr:hypothetical protein [Planctomycetota bacterium]